jgi:excisionase family DNA binding protein
MEEVKRVVLTVPEVGRKLSISRASAYALCKSEGFPSFRIGRRLLVPEEALNAWLDMQVRHQRKNNTFEGC